MNWIKNNWKWFCPLIFVGLLCIGLFFMLLLKQSDVYKLAVEKVKNNEQIIKKFGSPITPGFFISGTIKWAGPSGSANISFPIRGTKRTGVVFTIAEKHKGVWIFQKFDIKIEGQSSIEWIRLKKGNET